MSPSPRSPLAFAFALAGLLATSCVKPDPSLFYLCQDSGTLVCPSGRCNGSGQCRDDVRDGSLPDGSASVADASSADASTSDPDAAALACTASATCPLCQKCNAGTCVPQTDSEDLKDDCDDLSPCATGACDGNGACGLRPRDTPCRTSLGPCDVIEKCSGSSPACPADALRPNGAECRKVAGGCDVAETCDGTSPSCPSEKLAPAGKECRKAADACDVAESCSGTSADCPADLFRPNGYVCVQESCSGNAWNPVQTCDDQGRCSPPNPSSCAPYTCGGTRCNDTCASNGDCTTAVCDLRTRKCAAAAAQINCTGAPGALQAAIEACAPGPTCYLRVTGVCRNIKVEDKSVYIAGGTIDPAAAGGTAVAAVYVLETTGETTSLALAGVTVQGAFGAGGHGLFAEGTGSPAGSPQVHLSGCTVGNPTPGTGNDVNGIQLSNAAFAAVSTTVQNSMAAGLSAVTSDVTLSACTLQNNQGTGLRLAESAFTVQNTIIGRNGLAGASPGVEVHSTTAGLAKLFRFNTVAANVGGGIACSGSKGITAVVTSLFWNPAANESTGCVVDASSDVPGTAADACQNGYDTEPGFKKATGVDADFHLTSASPCIDKAVCPAEVPEDVDAQHRPQRATCDPGADEVP
ncbi:MAG TPA: right-handed parallel beta-helix repeat-containing protein [Myxococcales bacterium]|jgi:hypothetical protein